MSENLSLSAPPGSGAGAVATESKRATVQLATGAGGASTLKKAKSNTLPLRKRSNQLTLTTR